MSFQKLSELGSAERKAVVDLLGPDKVLSFYWHSGEADLARGIDNRLVRRCGEGQGVIIGACFGDLAVFSPYGEIADADIVACTQWGGAVEIHAPQGDEERYRNLIGQRLVQAREMLVYGLELSPVTDVRTDYRRLSPADLNVVSAFYRTHYPETAFAPYMLEMPFIGIFENEALVASAGTLARSDEQRTALIGHFLTAPAARGRGLAKASGRALLQTLGQMGYHWAYLTTTLENGPANTVYQQLGFRVVDRRIQFDLKP
ncbi:MAG: GNAT family N-acetyltransferase [Rhodospirillaceae bacterium]|nr:GNAT family N-acetyltransferase [Rhodospirillaceae bacterium]